MQIRFQLNIFAEETDVEVDRKKITSFHISNSPNCFLLTLAVFQNHYFLESQRDFGFPFPWFSSTLFFLLYALTETEKKKHWNVWTFVMLNLPPCWNLIPNEVWEPDISPRVAAWGLLENSRCALAVPKIANKCLFCFPTCESCTVYDLKVTKSLNVL